MDRVWQLENEIFRDTPGFVFAPFTDVVDQSEDATAMNPEVQQQASRMRTDLDRFSELEISSLIRHGYCVAQVLSRSPRTLWCRITEQRTMGSDSKSELSPGDYDGSTSTDRSIDGADIGDARRTDFAGVRDSTHCEHVARLSRLGVLHLCTSSRANSFLDALLCLPSVPGILSHEPNCLLVETRKSRLGADEHVIERTNTTMGRHSG